MPTRYVDPFDISPLNISDELSSHANCINTVRLRLAQAGLPPHRYTSDQADSMGQVTEQLGTSGCTVLILDRVNNENTFMTAIQGPGELDGLGWLMDELEYIPDWITLKLESPLEGVCIFFSDHTGLSSCRDYAILGTVCIECQQLKPCVDNLCQDCTAQLEFEAQLTKDTTIDTQFDNIPQVVMVLPDALENSYGVPRH